jgi:hypothetical protein
MPFVYQVLPDGLLSVRGEGEFSEQDGYQFVDKLCRDPAYRATQATLIDLRGMHFLPRSGQLRVLAERIVGDVSPLRRPVAIIVKHAPAEYGTARMAAGLAEMQGWEPEVFTDAAEAGVWVRAKLMGHEAGRPAPAVG